MTWQQNSGFGGNNNNRGSWGGRPKPVQPITTQVTTGGLEVSAPYNVDFVNEAKALKGRWVKEQKLWVFDPARSSDVEELLGRIYGDAWRTPASPATVAPRTPQYSRPAAPPAPVPYAPRRAAPVPVDYGQHGDPESGASHPHEEYAPQNVTSITRPVREQNGVKATELPAAFAERDPASDQEPPDTGIASEPVPNEPIPAETAPKRAAMVKGKVLRLGEELANLDFDALTCEELFAFSERLSNASRVLAFEAGRRPRATK